MADSAAFDFVCEQLEQLTDFDRLAARGTVRLALKQAGLEARSVSADQMKIVVQKLLPNELSARGVDAADGICQSIADGVAGVSGGAEPETPDAVFKRLGGS